MKPRFFLPLILASLVSAQPGGGKDTYEGGLVTPPLPKPAFLLTDTSGATFDFRRKTEGYVTLLFFGYTSCPDQCPMHMTNLSAALKKLPAAMTDQVKLVFVTTDPARDSRAVLRKWLDLFDLHFVGLTGSERDIVSVERAAGVPVAEKTGPPNGNYGVSHANFVIAYTRDNLAHAIYPCGVSRDDWVHDLPMLIKEAWARSAPSVEETAHVQRNRRSGYFVAGVDRPYNAEMTNPYASYLGTSDPLDVVGSTPDKVRRLLDSLGAQRSGEAPSPGKWCAREIACHLADCEIAFAFRLRQTLAEEGHVMQPFDQEQWAKHYSVYRAEDAVSLFSVLRQWNVALIRSLGPADLAKTANHPERGDMTFRTIVETMGGHDLNHLKQLEAIAGKVRGAS